MGAQNLDFEKIKKFEDDFQGEIEEEESMEDSAFGDMPKIDEEELQSEDAEKISSSSLN